MAIVITGDPSQIRTFIRQAIADGADFVKIFATASIRDGGTQTMTDDQIRAACDDARALGRRSIVHAQGPEGAKTAVLAGCTSIEHGNRLTDEVLDLMAARGASSSTPSTTCCCTTTSRTRIDTPGPGI